MKCSSDPYVFCRMRTGIKKETQRKIWQGYAIEGKTYEW